MYNCDHRLSYANITCAGYGILRVLHQHDSVPERRISRRGLLSVSLTIHISPKNSSNTLRRVKKYGLNMMVSLDDQVKAYVKKIMGQLNKWMQKSKISKLVIVVTSKETGEHVERWQFDVSPDLFVYLAQNPSDSRIGQHLQ